MKRFISMLAIFLASSLISMADTLDEALSFYNKGDYGSAIKLIKPLAEQGNTGAQIELGKCLLLKGDYNTAIRLLKPFAEPGNENAQSWLGKFFFERKDYALAIRWLPPFAEQGILMPSFGWENALFVGVTTTLR